MHILYRQQNKSVLPKQTVWPSFTGMCMPSMHLMICGMLNFCSNQRAMLIASSVLGTLKNLWITDDTIPLQNLYTNFLTVDLWMSKWLATTMLSAQLARLYRTMATCILCCTGARTVMSSGFRTLSIIPHNLLKDLRVVRKLSFHSSPSNSFKTTVSHQSLLLTRIQHVLWDPLCSREAAKFKNKLVACMAAACSIWRRRLPSKITGSKSAIVHLVCVIVMYTIYEMYEDVASSCSSYAIFLECRGRVCCCWWCKEVS